MNNEISVKMIAADYHVVSDGVVSVKVIPNGKGGFALIHPAGREDLGNNKHDLAQRRAFALNVARSIVRHEAEHRRWSKANRWNIDADVPVNAAFA